MLIETIGLTTTTYFSDGWQHTRFAGNPHGHRYGGPFEQITHHPWKEVNGVRYRDPNRCTERLTPFDADYADKLNELRGDTDATA